MPNIYPDTHFNDIQSHVNNSNKVEMKSGHFSCFMDLEAVKD